MEEQTSTMGNPIAAVFDALAAYGWYVVIAGVVAVYLRRQLKPKYDSWKQAREDAEYHKDPDKFNARLEAMERARRRQQELLQAASLRAAEEEKERAEQKRQKNLERLEKYGAKGGERLGSDEDYLPLSGGASTSSYRPPKRSACSRGGCGR